MCPHPAVDHDDRCSTHGSARGAFRHEALLYSGTDAFLAGAMEFIEEGLSRGEPVMVTVGGARIDELKGALGGRAGVVRFSDMRELGRNPARIIPAWRAFLAEHAPEGRPARGIGEPIWPGRSPAEIVECRIHEMLLGPAFADGQPWRLLCVHDIDGLEAPVIGGVGESHATIIQGGVRRCGETRAPAQGAPDPFAGVLPPPVARPREIAFAAGQLGALRSFASELAGEVLEASRVRDLVLALNELATNSIRHGGGRGTLRIWRDGASLLCEVSDRGRISDPLVGRTQPAAEQETGRGLWLVHHLCDLVQIRSSPAGTVVRVHMRAT
jgi:anti-sigma regulatory factor (Ser/Thr protein kinase)